MADADTPDADAIIRDRRFVAVVALAAVVGLIASFAAWCFLELLYYLQTWIFTDIPKDVGFDSTPLLWYPPILFAAGLITAFAIVRLPGTGGHIPANGLKASPTAPIELPGVLVAAIASIGLGLVVGPEAPLIALGGGLGALMVRAIGRQDQPQLGMLMGISATFAAVSFLFGSPIIAAVLLIEAARIGGSQMSLVLIPGLTAAGVGSLTEIGMGSWTGLDTSNISISGVQLASFGRPDVADFGWTILLAAAIAVGTWVIFRLGRGSLRLATPRPFIVTPLAGLAVAGIAILFQQTTAFGANEVLFSGQNALDPLVADAGAWSVGALALLIACKGVAYGISLGTFRGGPTFPAMLLGVAGGLMMASLPGFETAPAVAVGMGAAVAAVLRLPLSAIVLATVLTESAGLSTAPLIVIGVVVAYLITVALPEPERSAPADAAATPAPAREPVPSVAGG